MRTPTLQHTSYILRVWQAAPVSEYRFILMDVLTGEYWHFADLSGLYDFLSTILNIESPVTIPLEESEVAFSA